MRLVRREEGVSLVEYSFLLLALALLCVTGMSWLGINLADVLTMIRNKIRGLP